MFMIYEMLIQGNFKQSQINVKAKTYSFWTYTYHKVNVVIKVCIIVSAINESACRAYQGNISCFCFHFYGMHALIE